MTRPFTLERALALVALQAALGCSDPAQDDAVPVGLLLSYSGNLAANSTNSERGLRMAIEAANAAGGVVEVNTAGDRRRLVRVIARDTRSNPNTVVQPSHELLEAGAVLFIGPETPELAVPLVTRLEQQTIILPSFATAHSPFRRPPGWFVMGAGTARVACELEAQLRAHGRKKPLVLSDASGYNHLVAWELTRTYGMPQLVLPPNQASSTTTVQPITAAGADAYVLAALPAAASSLVYAMAATGALKDPTRWYLSPTLHTPALLETIPHGALAGARGVAPGTVAGATEFRAAFNARWREAPLDDAYPFYDAGAVAVLALQRAAREGPITGGAGLAKHVLAVTRARGMQIRWNELADGLDRLRKGEEIEYLGLSGPLQFDLSGQTPTSSTNWWTIGPGASFIDIPGDSDCR